MKIYSPLLFLALLAGCTSSGGNNGNPPLPKDSAGMRSPTANTPVEPAPADGSPMRTSATIYQLVTHPVGLAADIVFTYTNRSGAPLYLVNCNGDVSPALQRERGGVWENAWGPATNACLSPAVVIDAGGTHTDTLRMVVQPQDGEFYKEISVADGTQRYRLIWHQALSSFDGNARPFGIQVPIEQRVSNPFVFKAPDADPAAPIDGSPMRTSATVYQLVREAKGFATLYIAYTYTNRSGATIYLTNCNGNVSPSLQRERNGKWELAWSPIMNECLSAPVVIEAGATYRDSLRLEITAATYAEFYRALSSASSGQRYRLIWEQALASFDATARSFGRKAPIEQRVSNPFTFTAPR